MSAFICNPEHFAALAAFACTPGSNFSVIHQWQPTADREEVCAYVACELASHNIRAVAHRYPQDEDGSRPGATGTDAEIMAEAEKIARHYHYSPPPQLSPVDILSMCQCYEYQTSELPDYEQTPAAQQIRWIMSAAMRRLPGWDKAPWEFMDEHPFDNSRPVSLFGLAKKRA